MRSSDQGLKRPDPPDTPSFHWTPTTCFGDVLGLQGYSEPEPDMYDPLDFIATHLNGEDVVSLRRAARITSGEFVVTDQERKLRMCLEVVAECGWGPHGFYSDEFKTESLTTKCQEVELPTDKLTKALHITRFDASLLVDRRLASFSRKHRTYVPIMLFVERIYQELGGWKGHVERGKDAARRKRRREAYRASKEAKMLRSS